MGVLIHGYALRVIELRERIEQLEAKLGIEKPAADGKRSDMMMLQWWFMLLLSVSLCCCAHSFVCAGTTPTTCGALHA